MLSMQCYAPYCLSPITCGVGPICAHELMSSASNYWCPKSRRDTGCWFLLLGSPWCQAFALETCGKALPLEHYSSRADSVCCLSSFVSIFCCRAIPFWDVHHGIDPDVGSHLGFILRDNNLLGHREFRIRHICCPATK